MKSCRSTSEPVPKSDNLMARSDAPTSFGRPPAQIRTPASNSYVSSFGILRSLDPSPVYLPCRPGRLIDTETSSESGMPTPTKRTFPRVAALARLTPPRRLPLCSPASTVLRSHLTSRRRSCPSCRCGFTDRPKNYRSSEQGGRWDFPVLAIGISPHAQVLGLRRVRVVLADDEQRDVAFPPDGTKSAARK